MNLSRSERRFLRWVGTFCAPSGVEVGKVSTVIDILTRKGMVDRNGKHVRLTAAGIDALLATGWVPSIDGDRGHACACPCHTTKVRHVLKCCPPDADILEAP